jgi:hypothetical protein
MKASGLTPKISSKVGDMPSKIPFIHRRIRVDEKKVQER